MIPTEIKIKDKTPRIMAMMTPRLMPDLTGGGFGVVVGFLVVVVVVVVVVDGVVVGTEEFVFS